jgi:hypothetical protein
MSALIHVDRKPLDEQGVRHLARFTRAGLYTWCEQRWDPEATDPTEGQLRKRGIFTLRNCTLCQSNYRVVHGFPISSDL